MKKISKNGGYKMKLKTLKSDLKMSKAMKYLMRTVGRKVMEKYYARAMGIAIVEQLEKMLDPEIIAKYGKTRNERMAINNYIRSHLSIFQANQYSSNGRRRKGGDVKMNVKEEPNHHEEVREALFQKIRKKLSGKAIWKNLTENENI